MATDLGVNLPVVLGTVLRSLQRPDGAAGCGIRGSGRGQRRSHILQPDLVHIGGIMNTAEVASLAEANGIALAPHCPLSPVMFMASLQVVAQSRAGWILEWSKGIHYKSLGAKGAVDPWLRYVAESDWRAWESTSTGKKSSRAQKKARSGAIS